MAGPAVTPRGDHPLALIVSEVMLFREGLRSALERLGSLEIVATTTPEEARTIVGREHVDVVIIDASRRRSLSHASALLEEWPHLKLVAFGICSPQEMLVGAEFGISAFVGEDGEVADINRAALMALKGECHCTPQETARLLEHIANLARNVGHSIDGRLTVREREIASMVGEGLSNKEIAQELRISPATVKNHVHNILEKSQLPSRSAIGARLDQRHVRLTA